jgi:Ca2+-binding EF-hand superfamily protein
VSLEELVLAFETFQLFDKDGSGCIDVKELDSVLLKMGVMVT